MRKRGREREAERKGGEGAVGVLNRFVDARRVGEGYDPSRRQ